MILSTLRARIIFGFAVLLAASAGLGVLSSQWDLDSAEKQEFPAMRAPVQHKTPSPREAKPLPGAPSHSAGHESGKTGAA